MRVSYFGFLVLLLLSSYTGGVGGSETPSGASSTSFDQMNWNRFVESILGGVWVTSFGEHFTPTYFAANVTRETRISVQTNRLRARVAVRLMDSLENTEIICQQEHFSAESFQQLEAELKTKGWDAHWIPKTLEKECGSQSKGFLFVNLKK